MKPLAEIADVRLGRQRAPKNHRGNSMRPYLRAANVTWSGLALEDVKTMNFTNAEMDTYRLVPGDILLSEASGSAGEVGKPALWCGEIDDCAFQNTLLRVRPHEHEPKFLLHFLRWQASIGRFVEHSRGVGIHHLGRARLASWPTPVPPIHEQRRIVAILEDHLSRLDAAGEWVRASLRRLEVLRRLVVRELANGDMVPLSHLAVGAGYGTSVKCQVDGRGPTVVRIPNLIGGRIDLTDEKCAAEPTADLSRVMLAPGDVLIVRTNGSKDLIGRSAVVQDGIDAAFASYLIRYQVDTARIRPGWLQLMLGAPGLRAEIERLAASSAGQHNLSLGKLDGLRIPVPSLSAQDGGLARVTTFDDQTAALRKVLADSVSRNEKLRRTLLDAAFSGRLTTGATDLSAADDKIGA